MDLLATTYAEYVEAFSAGLILVAVMFYFSHRR